MEPVIGVVMEDGTVRTKGRPRSAAWRCGNGHTQVYHDAPGTEGGPDDFICDVSGCDNDELKPPPVRARPRRQAQREDPTSKPSNPKDIIGSTKVPLHLWPETASALGSLALLEGGLKYGRANFRAVGVRASIYVDAARRHLGKWFEGQDNDPESGLPHLAHALACLAILADSQAAGKLTDDRMVRGGFIELMEELTPHVARLKEKYADRDPKHYTIADNVEVARASS